MEATSEKQLTNEGRDLLERFCKRINAMDSDAETLRRSKKRAERYLMTEQFRGKYWVEKEKPLSKSGRKIKTRII